MLIDLRKISCFLLLLLVACGCEHIPNEISKSRYTFIGDSLVTRWDLSAYFPMLITYNHGRSGSGLKYLQDNSQIAAGETVVVLSGTNDLYSLNTNQEIKKYSESFVSATINFGAKRTYIISVLPRHFFAESYELSQQLTDRALRLNHSLREEIARINQTTSDSARVIEFVDVFSYFLGPEDEIINWQYFNDGLHLSQEGYAVLTYHLNQHILK